MCKYSQKRVATANLLRTYTEIHVMDKLSLHLQILSCRPGSANDYFVPAQTMQASDVTLLHHPQ